MAKNVDSLKHFSCCVSIAIYSKIVRPSKCHEVPHHCKNSVTSPVNGFGGALRTLPLSALEFHVTDTFNTDYGISATDEVSTETQISDIAYTYAVIFFSTSRTKQMFRYSRKFSYY